MEKNKIKQLKNNSLRKFPIRDLNGIFLNLIVNNNVTLLCYNGKYNIVQKMNLLS